MKHIFWVILIYTHTYTHTPRYVCYIYNNALSRYFSSQTRDLEKNEETTVVTGCIRDFTRERVEFGDSTSGTRH